MELKPLCASWQRYDGRELTSHHLGSPQLTTAHLFDYNNAIMAIETCGTPQLLSIHIFQTQMSHICGIGAIMASPYIYTMQRQRREMIMIRITAAQQQQANLALSVTTEIKN